MLFVVTFSGSACGREYTDIDGVSLHSSRGYPYSVSSCGLTFNLSSGKHLMLKFVRFDIRECGVELRIRKASGSEVRSLIFLLYMYCLVFTSSLMQAQFQHL